MKTDAQIKDDVTAALTWDPTIEWEYQRKAAEEGLRNLLGVFGVTNLVRVRTRTRPADVRGKIQAALARQSTALTSCTVLRSEPAEGAR